MMAGSTPSCVILCCTAPIGKPIFSILKYFTYCGSSFNGGPSSSSSSSSFFCWLERDLSGSKSMMAGSTPSCVILCCTAPIGKPIFSILKYFTYCGSSLRATSPTFDGKCSSVLAIGALIDAPSTFSSGDFRSRSDTGLLWKTSTDFVSDDFFASINVFCSS